MREYTLQTKDGLLTFDSKKKAKKWFKKNMDQFKLHEWEVREYEELLVDTNVSKDVHIVIGWDPNGNDTLDLSYFSTLEDALLYIDCNPGLTEGGLGAGCFQDNPFTYTVEYK